MGDFTLMRAACAHAQVTLESGHLRSSGIIWKLNSICRMKMEGSFTLVLPHCLFAVREGRSMLSVSCCEAVQMRTKRVSQTNHPVESLCLLI
jgi:hypothetical protein